MSTGEDTEERHLHVGGTAIAVADYLVKGPRWFNDRLLLSAERLIVEARTHDLDHAPCRCQVATHGAGPLGWLFTVIGPDDPVPAVFSPGRPWDRLGMVIDVLRLTRTQAAAYLRLREQGTTHGDAIEVLT